MKLLDKNMAREIPKFILQKLKFTRYFFLN